MGTHNLGPCGCCLIYDCECSLEEIIDVKITVSGFTGVCDDWNGEYFSSVPSDAIVLEDLGDVVLTIIRPCTDDWWGLSVSISFDTSGGCDFTLAVDEADEDPAFSCTGGTLTPSYLTSIDITGCPDCGVGTIEVEYIL